MATQNARLLNWLETHDGATTAEVTIGLKIYRLSERIRELESLGYRISHTPETTQTGARVIRYRLQKAAPLLGGAPEPSIRASKDTGGVSGAAPIVMFGRRVEIVAEYRTDYAIIEVVRDL